MESKLKYGEYQTVKDHYISVYQTFAGPLTLSGVQKVFADVERDAALIYNRIKAADLKTEAPRAAAMELAGRYIKVYSTLLVEKVYPESEKDKPFPMPDYLKLEKAVGQKIKD